MHDLPRSVSPSGGSLEEHPLPYLLLVAECQRLTGTLVLTDAATDQASRRILLADGVVVAGDFGDLAMGLLSELIPLCGCTDGHYLFVEGEDLVGAGRHVVCGRVDPYTLFAAALRADARGDLVDAALAGLGPGPLSIRSDCPLSRFGFTRQEWSFVQDVRRAPGTIEEILARGVIEPKAARRLLYLLLQTGVMVQLPFGRATESLAVSADEGPDAEQDLALMPTARPPVAGSEAYGEAELYVLGEGPADRNRMPLGMESDGRRFEAERHYRQACRLAKRQLHMAALQQVDAALALRPLNPDALALKAFCWWRMDSNPLHPGPEIMTLFDQALTIDPDCERAHHYRGIVLKAMGREDEANTHFARAAALDDKNAEAYHEVRRYVRRRRERVSGGFWDRVRRTIPPFKRVG